MASVFIEASICETGVIIMGFAVTAKAMRVCPVLSFGLRSSLLLTGERWNHSETRASNDFLHSDEPNYTVPTSRLTYLLNDDPSKPVEYGVPQPHLPTFLLCPYAIPVTTESMDRDDARVDNRRRRGRESGTGHGPTQLQQVLCCVEQKAQPSPPAWALIPLTPLSRAQHH